MQSNTADSIKSTEVKQAIEETGAIHYASAAAMRESQKAIAASPNYPNRFILMRCMR